MVSDEQVEAAAKALSVFSASARPTTWDKLAGYERNYFLNAARAALEAASLSPPVEGWRAIETAWNDRSVPTPKGTLIWVSDGEDIWLLEGDGNIFPDRATACRWWSQASFPTLPSGAVASNIDGFCIPSGPVGWGS